MAIIAFNIGFPICTESGVPGEAIAEAYDAFEKGKVVSPLAAAAVSNQSIHESMRLMLLVRSYQVSPSAHHLASSRRLLVPAQLRMRLSAYLP